MENLNCTHTLPTNAHSKRQTGRPKAWCAIIRAAALLLTIVLAEAAVHGSKEGEARARVVERGPHEQRWESVTKVREAGGTETFRTNSFVELGTGMNRWDANRAEWVPASDEIEIVNGYGIGRKTQHQVIFAPNTLAPDGLVDLETPNGERIVLQPIGLAVTDGAGRSVFLAEVKASAGRKVAPNSMLYPDAFDLVHGSICLKATVDGIESDVILSERISRALLDELGIDPDSAKLEVWHEVLKKPRHFKKRRTVTRQFGRTDEDHHVEFGGMSISSGTAFSMEEKGRKTDLRPEIVVAKEFIEVEGIDFLIESVPFADAEAALNALPELRDAAIIRAAAVERAPAGSLPSNGQRRRPLSLSTDPSKLPATRAVEFASAKVSELPAGYVIDYPITLTTQTNFTFRSDTTYYVTGKVLLHGKTRLEGGAVIKTVPYDPGVQAQVRIHGELECATGPYRPAIFTARDDDTVGEILPESIGTPATNIWYAYYNLAYFGATPLRLHDVQTRFAHVGLYMATPGPHQLSNLQVFRCYRGLEFWNAQIHLRNILLQHSRYALNPMTGPNSTVTAEHLTVDSTVFLYGREPYGSLLLRNSILCEAGNSGATNIAKERVETVTASAFQIVGRGRHYLPEGSNLRDSGTTQISREMAALLRTTTTAPPVILTNAITSETTLSPVVTRDSDLPDLGFHYAPLDYCASGIQVSNAKLNLAGGVAVGVYGTNGFVLGEGASLTSEGLPTQLNRLAVYNAVQGEPVNWGDRNQGMIHLMDSVGELDFRFTESSALANSPERRALVTGLTDTTRNIGLLRLRDCQLANFSHSFRTTATAPWEAEFSNNLFERCNFSFEQGPVRGRTYAPLVLTVQNNLFFNGTALFLPRSGATLWQVRDNFFDAEAVISTPPTPSYAPNYNAFRPGISVVGGPNNQTDVTAQYVEGPRGKFYYAAAGPMTRLVNAGSRPAGAAQLFHHTTDATALSKEGNNTVDIGFHFLAIDSTGEIPDTDQDGLRDLDEDSNENGQRDPDETNFADRDTDLDGDSDDYELRVGTDPRSGQSMQVRSLGTWRFSDTNFAGAEGQLPLALSNVSIVPGFEGNGAEFTSTNGPVILQYRGIESNLRPNVSLNRGAIRFRARFKWFSKDPSLDLPSGRTYGGAGPGEWATLIQTTNLAVKIDPNGTNILIISRTMDGQAVTNLKASFLVEREDPALPSVPGVSLWYDMLVNYSPEETSIFWGVPGIVFRGSGIQPWDGPSDANKILSIGSAADGTGKAGAILDELVTFNAPGVLDRNPWQFSAIPVTDPPALRLFWGAKSNLVSDIKKRVVGSSEWEWLPGVIGTNVTDSNVIPGVRYEYVLNSGFSDTNGNKENWGNHMTASVLGTPLEQRGKVILLVDETVAAPLSAEITTLVRNLVGDGWGVLRADVPRHKDDYSSPMAFVTNAFNITNRIAFFIRSNYTVFSTNIKHILIVGHVAIPYTGDAPDDGHSIHHQGTWASDLFYGDVDGIWRDNITRTGSIYPENWNLPGDGKLDEDYVPLNASGVSELEMAVARIDFARLPAFAESEVELLRRYLVKNSRYRHKDLSFSPATIGVDYFFDFRATAFPEQLAVEAASKFHPTTPWIQGDVFTNPNSFVLGLQAGSGNVNRINDSQPGREQTTQGFATNSTSPSCAFYLFRASIFQDWNLENDFMRAVLTPTNGGLAVGWFLTPGVWRTDPLAAGMELGAASRELLSTRLKPTWNGQTARATQILGDSTLRYPVIPPPRNLTRAITNFFVHLRWEPSPEPNSTYNVYRSDNGYNGTFVRLNQAPLTTTTYSNIPPRGTIIYMVRALNVSTTGSGSFTNLSQGIFVER